MQLADEVTDVGNSQAAFCRGRWPERCLVYRTGHSPGVTDTGAAGDVTDTVWSP